MERQTLIGLTLLIISVGVAIYAVNVTRPQNPRAVLRVAAIYFVGFAILGNTPLVPKSELGFLTFPDPYYLVSAGIVALALSLKFLLIGEKAGVAFFGPFVISFFLTGILLFARLSYAACWAFVTGIAMWVILAVSPIVTSGRKRS